MENVWTSDYSKKGLQCRYRYRIPHSIQR